MRKYTKGEGNLEVLRGAEAQTLYEFRQKIGKSSLTDFTDDELAELDVALKESNKDEKE